MLPGLFLHNREPCDRIRLKLEVPVYMDAKTNKRRKGMGLMGTLLTLFIMLKLAKVISWSWFWVFSPIWITIIIAIVLFSSILVAGRVKKGQW